MYVTLGYMMTGSTVTQKVNSPSDMISCILYLSFKTDTVTMKGSVYLQLRTLTNHTKYRLPRKSGAIQELCHFAKYVKM